MGLMMAVLIRKIGALRCVHPKSCLDKGALSVAMSLTRDFRGLICLPCIAEVHCGEEKIQQNSIYVT
jgi:hypothetical protein